jgi:integrase
VRAILLARDGRAPTEKWISLRTSDPKEAKRRRVKEQAKLHAEWDALRDAASAPSELPSIEELAHAAFEFVHTQFVAVHREKLRAQFAEQSDIGSIVAERKRSIALGAFLPPDTDQLAMEKLAVIVKAKRNWTFREDTVEGLALHQELLRLITRAVHLARAAIVDELEGRVPETDRDQVIKKMGVTPQRLAEAGCTIVELFDLFAAGARKKKDTLDAERKVIVNFAAFVGPSRDAASVTKAEFREFRNALRKVPVNWQLRKDLKGLSLREVAAKWSAAGGAGRNDKTVAREWSGLTTFYSWLVTEGYCDDNLTVGLAPRFDKKKGKLPTYSHEKLKAVFGSPLFGKSAGDGNEHIEGDIEVRDWRYWIPLCALYSGARAAEIAQLLPSDVRQEDGVWVFDFVETDDDTPNQKSLKTQSSRRIVPVHRALLALGFLDFVKRAQAQRQNRLFPQIRPCARGMLSTEPSKFMQRYLKRIGVKERGLALHSFRHTFSDEVRRKGGSDAILGTILGHAKGTVTAHYGDLTEGNLAQRRALIEAVDYQGLHCVSAAP